jgi:hypothetical protein
MSSTPPTLLLSAFAGGSSTSRHGDSVMVRFPASSFAASALEYRRAQLWASGRPSCGNSQRDRTVFTDRFETLLARNGSGLATKGSRAALRGLVQTLTQSGVEMGAWSIPTGLNDSVEIARRKPLPVLDAPTAPADSAYTAIP